MTLGRSEKGCWLLVRKKKTIICLESFTDKVEHIDGEGATLFGYPFVSHLAKVARN